MDIDDVLIWEGTNGLLLIPTVIGLVMIVRWLRGRPVFTESDWLFLFGHSRKEVFSLRLLFRFGAMLILVVVVSLGISFYVLPYGLGWFASAVGLTIVGILFVVPKWLR